VPKTHRKVRGKKGPMKKGRIKKGFIKEAAPDQTLDYSSHEAAECLCSMEYDCPVHDLLHG
jgi:hypothetical protein